MNDRYFEIKVKVDDGVDIRVLEKMIDSLQNFEVIDYQRTGDSIYGVRD